AHGDELRAAPLSLTPRELDDVAAGLEREPDRPPEVDARAPAAVDRLPTPAPPRVDAARDRRRQPLDLRQVRLVEGGEVLLRWRLVRARPRERRRVVVVDRVARGQPA